MSDCTASLVNDCGGVLENANHSAVSSSVVNESLFSIGVYGSSKEHTLSTKKGVGTGLPEILPVTHSRAFSREPAGYILVPATALAVHPVVTAAVTNIRIIPTLNSNSESTIVVVGSSSTSLPQTTFSSSSFSGHQSNTCPISSTDGINPGRCFVDNASLRQSMGRNRESLKRKLLQRRSLRELVEQGILPPPRTPPSFYEQRIKLERAKMGDILKHKIEHRPDKQQLVSQHILLDSCADPGIVDKQRQLKKCKLADSLNEKLANRPGPLELVQENILQVDAALEQAIKDGRVQFKPTSAGLVQKHPQPVFVVTQDASSLTPDIGTVGPWSNDASSNDITTTIGDAGETRRSTGGGAGAGAGGVCSTISSTKPKPKKTKSKVRSVNGGIGKSGLNGKPPPSASSKATRVNDPVDVVSYDTMTNGVHAMAMNCSGIEGNNDHTSNGHNFTPPLDDALQRKAQQETSYDLLLQQQQLLLQWQYELQQKYPNSTVQLVSLSSKTATDQGQQRFRPNYACAGDSVPSSMSSVQSSPGGFGSISGCCGGGGGDGVSPGSPAPLTRLDSDGCSAGGNKSIRRLKDMKVNDLKMECKRRNLPVSGSKSNIVERLKSYEDSIITAYRQYGNQQQECPLAGSNPNSPSNPTTTMCCQQKGALPPIKYLCASSSAQNLMPASGCGYHQNGPLMAPRMDVGTICVNRSSSSSDFPSNYSSPGIDLSALNFAGACSGAEVFSSSDSMCTTAMMGQYTSVANFGAQMMVTPCEGGNEDAGHSGYDNEHQSAAMDMDNGGQNGHAPFQQNHLAHDLHSSSMTPMTTSSPSSSSHHRQLPFLQAANTLAVHEEVLRQQQKKIEEVQKQIQKSQELLRQQQQMIVAAKQMQSEANEGGASDAECILSQLDTKQIQKAHIQLFLQQKIQQQQLQQQINVQQELMEIQQKLQEEMTVNQALNEVVRVLREDPRLSVLILHLLLRHRTQQQQQQPESSSSTAPSQQNHSVGECESNSDQQRKQSCLIFENPSSPGTNSRAQRADGMEYAAMNGPVSHHSVPKNRQGSGQNSKKSSLTSSVVRANSVPTSPAKSKSSSSMGDMEEIFRTVLDHATKATSDQVEDEQRQNTTGKGTLPSFDQFLQPSKLGPEIETTVNVSNGNGMTSSRSQLEQLAALDHPQTRTTTMVDGRVRTSTAAGCTLQSGNTSHGPGFMYTRNEAFDDLMEVLRNNDGPFGADDANMVPCSTYPNTTGNAKSVTSRQDGLSTPVQQNKNGAAAVVSQANQQLNLLSAYGAQEVADLLGTEWFNVESLLPQSTCQGLTGGREVLNSQTPEVNVFCTVSTSANSGLNNSSSDKPSGQPGNAGRNVVSSDMTDQMDWLDLILPSPSSGGGGVLHELPMMNCLPMDTDCMDAAGKKDTSLTDGDYAHGRNSLLVTSTHNPVLSMSACMSSEAI